jgi:hypothetical protein
MEAIREVSRMVQSQRRPANQQWTFYGARRGDLLQRHPVLIPVLLLACAFFLSTTGIFTDTSFPLLAIVGISSTQFCLSSALVLCIAGILAAITGIIEHMDRCHLQTATFPQSKEQNHAHRN